MRAMKASPALLVLPLLLPTAFFAVAQTAPPAHVDWRSAGAVTPVQDQGQCGADYAFAAVAALEGAQKIAGGHLVKLSEQELVDCSRVHGNGGCNGGGAAEALEWVKQHGIVTHADYPYTARDGQCRQQSRPAVHLTSIRTIATDMQSLLAAVATQPVAIQIDASAADYQHYEGGIYACHAGGHANHWVTIVGYGTTTSGQPYWIVKDSRGVRWGESGYMRLARSADCHAIFAAVAPKI